jgi:nucleoside-diphosphate-sugar epimerase
VNCVTGNAQAISNGAKTLATAALKAGCPRIVHLSSMAVYGNQTGLITEDAPLVDNHGWYGHAKIEAEHHMQRYAQKGGELVTLRPGVIIGPDSEPWASRFIGWLEASRLADLGALGDGPANLVDVEDVAQAVVKGLGHTLPATRRDTFNLAAPDSPRWNDYFLDLALTTRSGPLKRWGKNRLMAETYLRGVPLMMIKRAIEKLGINSISVPEGIPPSLTRLWAQQITLAWHRSKVDLGLAYKPYRQSLAEAAPTDTREI